MQVGLRGPVFTGDPDEPAGWPAEILGRLSAHGLTVDPTTLRLTQLVDPEVARSRAAVIAAHGDRAPEVIRAREQSRVLVVGPHRLTNPIRTLLRQSGVPAQQTDVVDPPGPRPDVVLLVRQAEMPRAWTDRWLRDSVPYLPVRAVEGRVIAGPFCVPDLTACLRCVDHQRSGDDPRIPLLVEQYAACPGGAIPEPVEATAWTTATALAAHDVVRFLDGHRPQLWSATMTLGGADGPAQDEWLRDPRCGCCWATETAVI